MAVRATWSCRSTFPDFGPEPVHIGDLATPCVPIGLFFGRLANFINGKPWGRVTDLPSGMVLSVPLVLVGACLLRSAFKAGA